MSIAYKRILLKLSGEVLAGEKKTGIDNDTVVTICKSVKKIADMGVEVGIVVGGGNFWRGRTSEHMDRTRADPYRYACNRYELTCTLRRT